MYLARIRNPNPELESTDQKHERLSARRQHDATTRRGGHRWCSGRPDFASITETVCAWSSGRGRRVAWYVAFAFSAAWTVFFFLLIGYLIATGIGVWGNNIPVAWAFDITNFVFWIGIGHAGTLISAILFLFRQKWRTGINRSAEAMTIFAVICAGMFPAHSRGPDLVRLLARAVSEPDVVWPNFRSPLLWDVFAVSTYVTVSVLFWYLGMIPDLATLRDRAAIALRQLAYGRVRPGLARLGPAVARL